MEGRVKLALIGAGMFGADVHLRAYAGFQRAGLAPQLGRIGLDGWARDLAPISLDVAAIAARSESSATRAGEHFQQWTGNGRARIGARRRGWIFCATCRTWM